LQLEQQEEYLIDKIKELKALYEEHEKLKHSHTSLIDPLEKENANLKTQLEVLTSKHVKLQKDHEMLKCSHDNLQDEYAMLQVSHEVMVTSVRHF
jgi:chromosome segregation ATPase